MNAKALRQTVATVAPSVPCPTCGDTMVLVKRAERSVPVDTYACCCTHHHGSGNRFMQPENKWQRCGDICFKNVPRDGRQ